VTRVRIPAEVPPVIGVMHWKVASIAQLEWLEHRIGVLGKVEHPAFYPRGRIYH